MSDPELSPYHKELHQDLIHYELFRTGLDAYARISGVSAEDALVRGRSQPHPHLILMEQEVASRHVCDMGTARSPLGRRRLHLL
jgi:hypothetical protein